MNNTRLIHKMIVFEYLDFSQFSVKNNPFASDLLQAIGLRDSSIRMSANQASCFAALRLVAMRVSRIRNLKAKVHHLMRELAL